MTIINDDYHDDYHDDDCFEDCFRIATHLEQFGPRIASAARSFGSRFFPARIENGEVRVLDLISSLQDLCCSVKTGAERKAQNPVVDPLNMTTITMTVIDNGARCLAAVRHLHLQACCSMQASTHTRTHAHVFVSTDGKQARRLAAPVGRCTGAQACTRRHRRTGAGACARARASTHRPVDYEGQDITVHIRQRT